jgi:calcineurin-like phosphoesterase family protein
MYHFISDTHFGHANIIKYCKRPFLTSEENKLCNFISKGTIKASEIKISKESVDLMDETIIHNINKTVDKDDFLIHLGDFCMDTDKKTVKKYRERIKCKNVYLILGNHDSREKCADVFTKCFENYLFNINGQKIFTSHYPARSWNKAASGAWMLYGHVHNGFKNEDNGGLSAYENHVYSQGIEAVLKRNGIQSLDIIKELMAVVTSTKGIDLTLDVGVDNVRPNVPFGTPWDINEIRAYMSNKMLLWNARKSFFKQF